MQNKSNAVVIPIDRSMQSVNMENKDEIDATDTGANVDHTNQPYYAHWQQLFKAAHAPTRDNTHVPDKESLSELCKINDILSEQIHHVIQETDMAAMTILTDGQQTEESVESAARTIESAITTSDENMHQENSEIGNVDEFIADLSQYIHRRCEEHTTQKQTISNILTDTKGLIELTSNVKKIAQKTNMLSMNARIEAARAGKDGLGFTVVAREVRDLSLTSSETAENIAIGIDDFKQSIEERLSLLLEQMASDRKYLGQVNALINHMTCMFRSQKDLFSSVLLDIRNATDAVTMAVMNNAASVQFQDITRQELEHVQKTLQTINDYIQGCARGDMPTPLNIKEISEDYRMSSQRKIHQAITGDSSMHQEDASASVELF